MRNEATKARLTGILNADKEEMNAATREAVEQELSRIAREFFEPEGELSLVTKRVKNGIDVSISFHASRVKNFTVIK